MRDVRFTPESGHSLRLFRCPLSAKSGHRDVEKGRNLDPKEKRQPSLGCRFEFQFVGSTLGNVDLGGQVRCDLKANTKLLTLRVAR
jgi:hypothetical protein